MTELDSAIERFEALIAETPSLWQSIDVRVLARARDGKSYNLLCTACMDRRRSKDIPRLANLPVSPPIACYQRILPLKELGSLLSEFRGGTIDLGGVAVIFTKKTSGPNGSPGPYDLNYVSRASRLSRPSESNLFAIGHSLTAFGDASEHLHRLTEDGVEGLDNALRRLPTPWDGLESIARFLLRTNSRVAYHKASEFGIYAPLEGRLDPNGCSIWNGKVSYSVLASAEAEQYVRLGYFGGQEDGAVVHGQISLGAGITDKSTGLTRWQGQANIEPVRRLSLFLSFAQSNIEKLEVLDLSAATKNPRVVGYSLLDSDLSALRGQLSPDRDSKLFEKVVARLFGFGGFIVDCYAYEKLLSDGPDSIAFAPDNSSALVIECTLGPVAPGSEKLSKLLSRAVRLGEMLGESAPGTILPVLVTSLSRNETSPSAVRQAAMDGVAVLVREDLEELIDLTLDPITPATILDFCLARGRGTERQPDADPLGGYVPEG